MILWLRLGEMVKEVHQSSWWWIKWVSARKNKKWCRRCFGNINWEIAEKKRKMKEAEVSTLHGNNVEIWVQLKNELASLLVKEEQMWHQRTKTH